MITLALILFVICSIINLLDDLVTGDDTNMKLLFVVMIIIGIVALAKLYYS